jgi:hypothetical protein
VVSAVSKRPASKAPPLDRVDVYAAGRPVRSIDARNGAVRPTRIALGPVKSTVTAEVHAWDVEGLLVAFRRVRIAP